jgi:integrase
MARIMLADFDPAVVGIAAQPMQLCAPDGGRLRRHVPDLLLVDRAGGVTVVDVKDSPRTPRTVDTDGHIGRDWFRRNVWTPALKAAELDFHLTPHGLRHAHASWLLAGGADLQVVKERLGHGSIRTTERYLHTLADKADDTAISALRRVRGRSKVA